jgi:hypothetical protein
MIPMCYATTIMLSHGGMLVGYRSGTHRNGAILKLAHWEHAIMPKKENDITVPMSDELLELIEEPLGYQDRRSVRIRELIRKGLDADGVDPDRIPQEDDQRAKDEPETDGGQTSIA